VRDAVTQKFRRISDPDEIERAIDSREEHYRIYTKDPNVQGFTNLLNRALNKPAEHVQVDGAVGGPLVIRWQRDEEPSGSEVRVNPSPDGEKNGNG
jgi:hypothetical protein